MRAAGIVAEYNPLHNGHLHQIAETRRAGATHIVAVLSGNFVQRAEPACLDKFTRALLACKAGADLVVELPAAWATGSSERFARGAISLFKAMGCIELLSFGSECADLAALQKAAAAAAAPGTIERTSRLCESGMSYPAARARAVRELYGDEAASVLQNPNDILAVDYLKAIEALECDISALAIPRAGAGHDAAAPRDGFASASWLRSQLSSLDGMDAAAPYLPDFVLEALRRARENGRLSGGLAALEPLLLYRLRCMDRAALCALPDCATGLGDRLFHAAAHAETLDALFAGAKTRRYTMSRVRRAVLHAALGITAHSYDHLPPYLRLLAIGPGGETLLREIGRHGALPVSHSLRRLESLGGFCADSARTEAAAGELYAMSLPRPAPRGADYTAKLYRAAQIR